MDHRGRFSVGCDSMPSSRIVDWHQWRWKIRSLRYDQIVFLLLERQTKSWISILGRLGIYPVRRHCQIQPLWKIMESTWHWHRSPEMKLTMMQKERTVLWISDHWTPQEWKDRRQHLCLQYSETARLKVPGSFRQCHCHKARCCLLHQPQCLILVRHSRQCRCVEGPFLQHLVPDYCCCLQRLNIYRERTS